MTHVLPRCHSDISVFVKMTFSTLKILRIVNVIFYMFISVIKVKPNLLMEKGNESVVILT